MIMSDVVDHFLDCAALNPTHPAVVCEGITTTYGALERRVRAFALAFATVDAPRVLIALPQCADAYAALLAAGLAGGYHSPLNIAAPLEKLARIARLFKPNVIVGTGELATALAAEAPHAIVCDPSLLNDSAQFEG